MKKKQQKIIRKILAGMAGKAKFSTRDNMIEVLFNDLTWDVGDIIAGTEILKYRPDVSIRKTGDAFDLYMADTDWSFESFNYIGDAMDYCKKHKLKVVDGGK